MEVSIKFSVMPSDYKCCATCQHWEGTRRLTNDGNNVQFDLANYGVCSSVQSLSNSKEMNGKAICTHWTKWYMIR